MLFESNTSARTLRSSLNSGVACKKARAVGRSEGTLGMKCPPIQHWRSCELRAVLKLDEEKRLLAIARPRIRALIVLGVETGMRTGEMLGLRWEHIDFLNNCLQVEKSKTRAGIRTVPLTAICKSELLRWRNLIGPEYSEWVFPSFSNRRHQLQGGRTAWASELKKAGIPFFPIYNLRHTFASRMTATGVYPITIADAWTCLNSNCASIFAGSGSESVRCNKETGISSSVVHFK